MLQFNMMGFRVGIDPFFWITTAVMGTGLSAPQSREDWIRVALWVIVVFISILIHELGHALAARKVGYESDIVLHSFGGVTIIPHARFTRGQSIFVSAAGPFAGFILGGISLLLDRYVETEYTAANTMIRMLVFVNIFWTLINLLPILPMDGGQIFRELLGPGRLQIACVVGGVVGVAVAAWAISKGLIFLAAMLGYFAWVNFTNGTSEGGVMKG